MNATAEMSVRAEAARAAGAQVLLGLIGSGIQRSLTPAMQEAEAAAQGLALVRHDDACGTRRVVRECRVEPLLPRGIDMGRVPNVGRHRVIVLRVGRVAVVQRLLADACAYEDAVDRNPEANRA